MSSSTTRVTIELRPSARVDVIDVNQRIREEFGDVLASYQKALYCSYHTTAGYFDQGLISRLNNNRNSIEEFLAAFQELFPPGAEYKHDQLHLRTELTEEARRTEPRNADSHLKYIGSGLENCVAYSNSPDEPVYFVDLDGVNADTPRRRLSTVIGYHEDVEVETVELNVPVSGHAIDSISLKDPRLGLYDQLQELVSRHGIERGCIEIELDPRERNVGLTVNEYETLLMKHDLIEVLTNPVRFMAEKGRSMLRDPRAIPGKARNYAKYDLVRVLNQALDALGLSESVVERVIDRLMALPASRFLGMRRSIRLLICDAQTEACGPIVEGTYQSPILVQWAKSSKKSRRLIARVKRCV